jgi:uncharacterized CHY-type Zn-finger protein
MESNPQEAELATSGYSSKRSGLHWPGGVSPRTRVPSAREPARVFRGFRIPFGPRLFDLPRAQRYDCDRTACGDGSSFLARWRWKMAADVETVECPYCKEDIRADAVICKHCRSRLQPQSPEHGGRCPYCKEEIHPDAIRCKHCGSDLRAGSRAEGGDCGCGGAVTAGAPVAFARAGIGVGYNPACVESCLWQCGWAGGDRWTCWQICSWLCTFGTRTLGNAIAGPPPR